MKFEIKHRWNGEILFEVEAGDFRAALEIAVKKGANLVRANLDGANLYGANLVRANLDGANLDGANLVRANLDGAKGVNPLICTPLLMLLDQPGPIRAYKLVTQNMEGPWHGGLKYKIGKKVSVKGANKDVTEHCGAGINLATLNWCMVSWKEGYRILIAEFEANDIAAIPTATDGKFRVHRCKIVGEKDLVEIGLVKKEKKDAV